MNLRLRSIRWTAEDVCEAEIHDTLTGETSTVTFTLQRDEVGVGVVPSPDVFWGPIDATAADVRDLVAVVVIFCRSAQGEKWR